MEKKPLIMNDHDLIYGALVNITAAFAGFCNSRGVVLSSYESLAFVTLPSISKIPIHLMNQKIVESRRKRPLQDISHSLGELFKGSANLEQSVEDEHSRKFIDRLTEASAVGLNYQVIAFCAYGLGYMAGRLTDS